jgi:enoyl-CoA hydratase
LALACDVRVADRTARISQAEIRIGLIPGGGGTQRLARLVGRGWASIISLTGDFVEAEEAHRIGLVDILVDEGEHVGRALELAGRMARWSPVSLRLAKDAIRAALEMPLAEGLAYERERFLDAFASHDGREGVAAFVEKRKPHFEGR